MTSVTDPRYPIGAFRRKASYTAEKREQYIGQLKQILSSLKNALAGLSEVQLEVSVALLEALHTRWAILFESLAQPDWKREYRHPEGGVVSIEATLAAYVWHGQHHVAHITQRLVNYAHR